ncbi:hypothetical protein [Phyllobacterium ifriqiyense]|uniref:hypothetical protein n=1 Tax=Phyllobacterium ifriqiyense TaxID=314238 RepID=UPI0033934452
MPKFVTIGYGDQAGYERTAPEVRDAAHAHDGEIQRRGVLIGAGIIGLFAGAAFFGVMACLFATLRSPFLRFAVAVIFATPAVIAGYALVYGVSREAVPSEIWRQAFSIAGGACAGLSALARLAESVAIRCSLASRRGLISTGKRLSRGNAERQSVAP